MGQCRCLSTYIAVDAYCYERISPSESGCFYDIQCSAVWPDAFCKNGQCHCPNQDMTAVKTRFVYVEDCGNKNVNVALIRKRINEI
ncbi:hypothetical protein GCK32_022076 [Trichostrongylus colubriformis]|uniref:EB domain-containing protein n=1 Tax=Trichostrongylus colubriformis TaxID=6319 RepID=A0AAN8EW46_TRICO